MLLSKIEGGKMKENKDIAKNSVKNRTKKKHKLLTEIRFSTGMKRLCQDTNNNFNTLNDKNVEIDDKIIIDGVSEHEKLNDNCVSNYNINHDNDINKGLYDENNNVKKPFECHKDESENDSKNDGKSNLDLIKRKVDERLAIKLNKIINTLLL